MSGIGGNIQSIYLLNVLKETVYVRNNDQEFFLG